MHRSLKETKAKLREIIFGVSTPAGRAFDIVLIILIVLSIFIVLLESVPAYHFKYGDIFYILEWGITVFFTIEYVLRIWIVDKPSLYIFSFYGIIDFLSILPSFLGLYFVSARGLSVIRGLRLLRIFRIFKLNRYSNASSVLMNSLRASTTKISVFLFAVIMLVVIIGTLMYLIEGAASGFTSIPRGIYWAIVTLTTVGYGDITPVTSLGQFLASIVMILGYGVIAVPTGIVTAEISNSKKNSEISTQVCDECMYEEHDHDAKFCKKCGNKL